MVGWGIDDLMRFPVAEKISPIFLWVPKPKREELPQVLTESAGIHPATRGHCQNVKICGEWR